MSVSTNDITGDLIKTKLVSDSYRNNYDNIFRKEKPTEDTLKETENVAQEQN